MTVVRYSTLSRFATQICDFATAYTSIHIIADMLHHSYRYRCAYAVYSDSVHCSKFTASIFYEVRNEIFGKAWLCNSYSCFSRTVRVFSTYLKLFPY